MKLKSFPMPGDHLGDYIVIASVYYNDESATLILLAPVAPFYTVAYLDLITGDLDDGGIRHENIVPAVREYEQLGGDY